MQAFVVRLDKLDRKIRGWKPFVHATSFLDTVKKVEPELAPADETPVEEAPQAEGHLAEAVSISKLGITKFFTSNLLLSQ